MRAAWYPVLQWAARRGQEWPFSTLELAQDVDPPDVSDLDEAGRLKRSRAHAVTQKLWKWGYLRKASPPAPVHRKGRKSSSPDPEEKRPVGRPPAFWVVTLKGLRRAKKKYAQKFFPIQNRNDRSTRV